MVFNLRTGIKIPHFDGLFQQSILVGVIGGERAGFQGAQGGSVNEAPIPIDLNIMHS
jgi:hypothetical protein